MFSPTCVPHTDPFSTPEFLLKTSHYLTVFTFPISIFGGFCILYKTPTQMNSLKWLMFNLHVWTTATELLISFVGIPYILLPTMSGFGLGIIKHTGVLFYLFITMLEASAASVIAIFENRYFILFGHKTWWSQWRKRFLMFMCSLVPLTFMPPYLDIPNQEAGRTAVYSSLPCVAPLKINDRPLFVLSLDLWIPFSCMAFNTVTWSSLASLFFSLTIFQLWYGKNETSSQKTVALQKKFALAISIQTTVMVIFLLAPVCICLFVTITDYHDQSVNNFAFLVLSLHGVAFTITMILVNKPYRDFTLSKVFCLRMERQIATPRPIIC